MSSELPYEDFTLRGLESLLARLPRFDSAEKAKRARLLWEALVELLESRGPAIFSTTYRWTYVHQRSTMFDAAFVRLLNGTEWVPDPDGELQRPSAVIFESLDWRPNPVLQSKINFKKPMIETLAREVGIDLAVLVLLKQLGLTSLAELQARLEIDNEKSTTSEPVSEGAASTPEDPLHDQGARSQEGKASSERGTGYEATDDDGHPGDQSSTGGGRSRRTTGSNSEEARRDRARDRDRAHSERRFVSYVAVGADEDEADEDGLDHLTRMALEAEAITLAIEREPTLERTPAGNEGFDLVETDASGEPERWVEIKAMKGTLMNRPVALTPAQFEFARRAQTQYWLYVVEEAGQRDRSRIVKIQNPAGQAGSFTFDRGWLAVAEIDSCDAD
jgi:hypothetical protein